MKQKENIIEFNNEVDSKKINKKKLTIAIVIGIAFVIIIILYLIYSMNVSFRNWWDINILRKRLKEENLNYIQIDNVNQENIFAYSNYIAYIKDNEISVFDSGANKVSNISVQISSPIIDTNGEYVVVAEKEGQKIYLISRSDILWEKELEGNISKVKVNNNGYVSVIVSGTSYKSVIVLLDYEGKELFKTYLGATIAVDSDISPDNKYMSFAEVNMEGTLIQSNIKIISVEKAKDNKEDSIIYKYAAPADSLILNIKYQGKKLVCMYDNSIHVIESDEDRKIVDLQDKNITFADIKLNNNIVRCFERNDSLFSIITDVEILNSTTEKKNIYTIKGEVKGLYVYGDKIGINQGLEVHFINPTGWLIKKYACAEEVKRIVLSNNIAGVIYKKKIEIVRI